MQTFIITATIQADNLKDAEQIAAERLGYDEDMREYGIADYIIGGWEVEAMTPDDRPEQPKNVQKYRVSFFDGQISTVSATSFDDAEEQADALGRWDAVWPVNGPVVGA